MKKKVRIVIGVVIGIAILVMVISLFFPAVFKGITSGTFGKADKYRKTQMTEKDVQLRSEFTADTGRLRSNIQGLIYFMLFTQELSYKIDSCVIALENQGMTGKDKGYSNILVLKDYSEYIKNNNKVLEATINMLSRFYFNDQPDQSVDVEKNLRDFGNYVNNLNEKDSILDVALHSMDNFMLTNKTLTARKSELTRLKEIRDQLMIGSIQLSGMLQDKDLCASLCSYAISSQQNLNIILSKEKLGILASQENMNAIRLSREQLGQFIMNNQLTFGSAAQLGKLISAQQSVNVVGSGGKDLVGKGGGLGGGGGLGLLTGNILVYDRSSLQFYFGSAADMKIIIPATQVEAFLSGSQQFGNILGIGFFSRDGLNMYQPSVDIKSVYQSQSLGIILGIDQLNLLLSSPQGIGSVPYCSNFLEFFGQLNIVI